MSMEVADAKLLRSRQRQLSRHAAQLGRLCVLWSSLELEITHLLIAIAKLDDPVPKNVILGELDMPGKARAVLAIGYKRKHSDVWFGELNGLILEINGKMRDDRNRMIHDFWTTFPDESGAEIIQRMQLKARFSRNKSASGERILNLATVKPVQPADIAKLCDSMIEANLTAIRLRREFERSPLLSGPNPSATRQGRSQHPAA